ncbi:uncharacterized protein [Typha angustifolia]|uniref:uncharacterized protein isoform X1 n=1 Tax=Typha angustifolia TaxID=59011 RepID=UPI003C2D1080
MFAKRLIQKALHQHELQPVAEMNLQIPIHYGVPNTASLLAYDPIQRLLAIGTLDGRIKIIGGENIEGLLLSLKKVPYKYLEFLQNQGFLVAISNENEIQVWNLELRQLFYCAQWDVNITAFAVIPRTFLMFLGDENGLFSVLKFDVAEGKLQKMPYHVPVDVLTEAAGISLFDPQPIVGILPQPYTSGTRVLIVYEKGLLVLWDISENRVVAVRGYGNLQLKGEESTDSQGDAGNELLGGLDENEQQENEICSFCWASNTGSVVAIGYITGDILLWNMSPKHSVKGKQAGIPNVVKLQLSSGNRRLPVIVLHWSASSKTDNDKGGHLFVYGGDDMGSEEVLTVLSLECSSGLDSVKCTYRMDLKLNGSFADMILIPDAVAPEKDCTAALLVLANPGQLSVYDGNQFSVQNPGKEEKFCAQAENFPVTVPTIDPCMTVAKLCLLPIGKDSSKGLLKKFYTSKTVMPSPLRGSKWPLTGGVPGEMLFSEDHGVRRIYIAGYKDGSVRIWDATFPILTLMFVLEGKVPGIEIDGENASVSSLDFCSLTVTLAVGSECGLVRVYKFHENTEGSSFHFVSESKQEVHIVHHGKGFHCNAAFMVLKAPVRKLQYGKSGERLAIGFESGQVAMLDVCELSVMFCTDCASGANSPVISLSIQDIYGSTAPVDSPQKVSPDSLKNTMEVLIILTKDARVTIVDSTTGVIISSQSLCQKQSSAISMYVIDRSNVISGTSEENYSQHSPCKDTDPNESEISDNLDESKTRVVDEHQPTDASDLLLLLCCEDVLHLYSLKSIIQGDSKHLHKVKLAKQCCWSTNFKTRDEKACGLLLIYQTGDMEFRSLLDLERVGESSLMSLLRWSFKTNMDKTMSSSGNGQVALVSGSELAFISILNCENDFRIPESLPFLHDRVLAAAAEAAINACTRQKKKQETGPRILGGIIKGLKGGRTENYADIADRFLYYSSTQQLEELLSKIPFVQPSITSDGDLGADELSIDDIEIDDTIQAPSTSTNMNKKNRRDAEEREKLFEGSSDVTKPRVRTTQEILTQYRFAGDASAAAAHAKDKLVQRQEKLERLSQRTAELQSGAENFHDMANELVKAMENKKWWKI